MDKKDFIRKMQLIQNFHSEQETVAALINRITDSSSVVVKIGNYLVESIIISITKELGLLESNNHWIEWWLYEDVDKVVYDDDEIINVETLDNLYDFLIELRE